MRISLHFAIFFFVAILSLATGSAQSEQHIKATLRVRRFLSDSQVELTDGTQAFTLHIGDRHDSHTLVQVLSSTNAHPSQLAILEDFSQLQGHIVFVDTHGVQLDLPKSTEKTSADSESLYRGHSIAEIKDSPSDLIADEILARPGDPAYEEVAAVLPPIRKLSTYSFVGTPDTFDKIGFNYGGRTPDFDPAAYFPAINKIRERAEVLDGLVGGYLPILRFVYPESPDRWMEMLAFAPFRISNSNDRIQPVWYRLAEVANGTLKSIRYVDSYHPFPPRTDYDPRIFYRDLADLKFGWDTILQSATQIELPDERLTNMARLSLIRAIMTRIGDYPKYGVFEKDYGGSEHDGFPDTFTVETTAMLDWGLVDRAGRYIDNYFGKFVRDDGSILYRGPETGQYGRMLTVLAQYVNLGRDPDVLLRRRSRIDGVTNLLLHLRAKAKSLPVTDPAYGMIAGWSEADACLDPDPPRYMQPYFSNSTEAARGFHDLGLVWEKIGKQRHDATLITRGKQLVRESRELRRDVETSIARSLLVVDGQKVLPSIAGVQEPFHVVVPRDPTDPQYRSYRADMEMLYSGSLSAEQSRLIFDYLSTHHDFIAGMPTAYGYNTGVLAGFLSYGYAHALIQHDEVRRALLLLYSDMAHQYTRGTWTAPETRDVFADNSAAPYCTPAQLIVPLITRWLLVFDDPQSDILWLAKATPRDWLADGKRIKISNARTRWGALSYSLTSHLQQRTIDAHVTLPASPFPAEIRIRLRTPDGYRIQHVTLNNKSYSDFDPQSETITLPAAAAGTLDLRAFY